MLAPRRARREERKRSLRARQEKPVVLDLRVTSPQVHLEIDGKWTRGNVYCTKTYGRAGICRSGAVNRVEEKGERRKKKETVVSDG